MPPPNRKGTGGRKPAPGGRQSMNEEAASGGGEHYRQPVRQPYDPSSVWREATNEQNRLAQELEQRQTEAESRAFAQAQGQWGVPGHYGPAAQPGGKGKPRRGQSGVPGGSASSKKGARRPQGLGSLPSVMPSMENSGNESSYNSDVTRANGETVEEATQRKRSTRKQQKSKPHGHGAMYAAPWQNMHGDQEFQMEAARHMSRTPEMKMAVNTHYKAKYAHPTGNESWHVGKEENWGMGEIKVHRKAISSLKETIKRPDLALLAALRADMIRGSSGVSNNVELGSIEPLKGLDLAKTLLKQAGSVTRLTVRMADDATRLEGFTEYVAQLQTAREGQAWVSTQLGEGKQSKSGKHVAVAAQLENIKAFYKVQEELALANIRSLRETQAPTVGYDRIDRMFRDIALDINRAQTAYEEAIEVLDKYPGYREMIDIIAAHTADEEDDGVRIPNISRKMNQLASLIIASDGLHPTERGTNFIKEKMFDALAHFKLLILYLEYGGEPDYSSLSYINFELSQTMVNDLMRRSSTYRRVNVYESGILLAGGAAIPIELLKSVGRALKASTRTLGRGVRNIRGNEGGINGIWEATKVLMKRACQPLFGALTNLVQDYFEDSPYSEALSMNMEEDVEPAQIEAVVEDLRQSIVARFPEKQREANQIAYRVQGELAICSEIRENINTEYESMTNQGNENNTDQMSLSSIMKHFDRDVKTKLRNRRSMMDSTRDELREQGVQTHRFISEEAPLFASLIEQPIPESVAEAVIDGSQEGSTFNLPMTPHGLNDYTQVQQDAENVLQHSLEELQEQLRPAPSAPPLVNYNSNTSF